MIEFKMSGDERIIKVGSRKSQLAMVQTDKVIAMLTSKFPHLKFEMVTVTTIGDKVLDKPLSKIGEKNLFTKELEVALMDLRVDFVVHSLKDVPTDLLPNLSITAVCKRDDSRDAVLIKKGHTAKTLAELPKGSVVGTSSMRRTARLKNLYPDLTILDVRGNLNSRLIKLDEEGGAYDALVLATAGLERLAWHSRISQVLDTSEMMYAIGQGAMCAECRIDDLPIVELLSHVNDPITVITCMAERVFLRRLEGGCSLPVAALCEIKGETLSLKGGVYSIDGTVVIEEEMSTTLDGFKPQLLAVLNHDIEQIAAMKIGVVDLKYQKIAEKLGIDIADKLRKRGAADWVKKAMVVAVEKKVKKEQLKNEVAARDHEAAHNGMND